MWIDGPAGRIDARFHGEGHPVLVCHPHPLHGGTKGTRLVYLICEALAEAGFQAIRFDFRGAGRSEGEYDGGPGETEDALAVWDHIERTQHRSAAVIGFSFGGGVALRVATRRAVPGLIMVATPSSIRDSDLRPEKEAAAITCPTHVIVGTQDEHVHTSEAEAIRRATGGRITVLEGADHFLTPDHHERAVRAVVQAITHIMRGQSS